MRHISFLLAVFMLCTLFAGCAQEGALPVVIETEVTETETSSAFPEDQRLRLTVTYDDREKGAICPDPDRPPFFYYEADSINYENLTDIRIEIDGETMLLRDAMEQDLVTTDELEAWARVDAKRGYCDMAYGSTNGFAQYDYKYPSFTLRSRYDVYEAPNGELYHDQLLILCDPGLYMSTGRVIRPHPRQELVSEDNPAGELDRENWGVKFEVLSASPTQLTLRCTQSGGQHMGQLSVDGKYTVYQLEGNGFIEKKIPIDDFPPPTLDIPIENEGITEFTITWPESLGELPSGEYEVHFFLKDNYETIPELMRNYEDEQWQVVGFTV